MGSACLGYLVDLFALSSLPFLSWKCRFFLEQNNRIFQTLLEVSASQDKTLTAEHARGMGLDPQGDRSFLMDLLEAYGIDVMLVIDNPCCP